MSKYKIEAVNDFSGESREDTVSADGFAVQANGTLILGNEEAPASAGYAAGSWRSVQRIGEAAVGPTSAVVANRKSEQVLDTEAAFD